MFNMNDKFYQDICSPYKTENSTDILLSDRIDFIYNNDDAQCQTNCQFSEYLLDTDYMSCECSLDGKNINNKKDKFNAKKLYESFYEVLKYSNYQVYKCYNLVFIKEIYHENIGGIIIFTYFSINISCFIFYIIKQDISLKNEIINLNKDINNNKDGKINVNFMLNKEIKKPENIEKISHPVKKKKIKIKIKIRRSSKTILDYKKPTDELILNNKEINISEKNVKSPIIKKSNENSDITIFSKDFIGFNNIKNEKNIIPNFNEIK